MSSQGHSYEFGERGTAHANSSSDTFLLLAPRPPKTNSTGRPRSASLTRKEKQSPGPSNMLEMMSTSDRTKALAGVRMLQEYGFEKVDNLEEFALQLEIYADQDIEKEDNAAMVFPKEQHHTFSLAKQCLEADSEPLELSSSFLSESGKSLAHSGSTPEPIRTANGFVQPSGARCLNCPTPPTMHTMDGYWKVTSASFGTANIACWLKRLRIIDGKVCDGTGQWKTLKMVNGVTLLDGGELQLDAHGHLRRYGKKRDTVVCFVRDRTNCQEHSPKRSPRHRIQREVRL